MPTSVLLLFNVIPLPLNPSPVNWTGRLKSLACLQERVERGLIKNHHIYVAGANLGDRNPINVVIPTVAGMTKMVGLDAKMSP